MTMTTETKSPQASAFEQVLKKHNLTLLDRHKMFIERARAKGATIATYRTPCCAMDTEDRLPCKEQGQWDSLTQCPHCRTMFVKIATHEGIKGLLP